MKAAVMYDDRDIRLGEMPDPQVGPDDVLVAPSYAGICGTDLHIFRGEFHNRVTYPAVLGHEFGGIVVETGKNVKGFKRGDRVTVDPILSCHKCPACLTGHLNACRTLKLLGVEYNGGFGQFVAAPASHVFALPDNFEMKFVSMVEMYGLACHVLGRGLVQPGESVVLIDWSLMSFVPPVGPRQFERCDALEQLPTRRMGRQIAHFSYMVCRNWQGPLEPPLGRAG